MKVADFIDKVYLAVNSKTLYVMGGWGYPLNENNKARTQSNSYNQRAERKSKIYAASADTFAFDCCGLCKAVLWGWDAETDKRNGGATYADGMPDWDAKEIMFKGCTDPSTDFSSVDPGEFLWMDGHCGIYLGNGIAAESTPLWKDGVQLTAVANISDREDMHRRIWTYHGHLKYIDYSSKYPAVPFIAHNTLKGVAIRSIPYSDGKIIGYILLGADVKIEDLQGSSGDFGKIEGYVYLPGGFDI